ncbi:SYP81 [Scenedesmus sp. PABB004]|nr:SYP81 [Scenedesmus sp. PABB004]
MDRTPDWAGAVDAACAALELSTEDARRAKAAILLKPARERSQFATVAAGVAASIAELRDFIATNKRDYLSTGKLSEAAKDAVEERVGGAVRGITAHLDALKDGVLAAQDPPGGGPPLINQQSAAHLHGAVLVLVEQLQRAHAAQQPAWQQQEQEQQQRLRRSSDGGGGGGGLQQVQQQDATRALLEELRTAAAQARGVERTVREISTINQMLSTAVMAQAEAIETLYSNAVEASGHLAAGNAQLRRTIAVNRSGRRYMLVLLLTAALLLLFFDWFNS